MWVRFFARKYLIPAWMVLAAWFVTCKCERATFFLPSIEKMFDMETTTRASKTAPQNAKTIVTALPGSVFGK